MIVGSRSSVASPSSSLARMALRPTAVAAANGTSSYEQSSLQWSATATKASRSRSANSWRSRSALRLILLQYRGAAAPTSRTILYGETGERRRGGIRSPPADRAAHLEGFDLHADITVGADDRAGLKRLCRN